MAQRTAAKKGTVKTSGAGKTTATKKKAAPSPVYFLSLELENVRCFGPRQKLDLSDGNGRPARWTVILGENGVGKTTLLQCLARFQPSPNSREKRSKPLFNPKQRSQDFESVGLFEGILEKLSDQRTVSFLREKIKSPALALVSFYFGRFQSPILEKENKDFSFAYLGSERMSMTFADSIPEKASLVCFGYGAGRNTKKSSLSNDLNEFDACQGLFDSSFLLPNAEEWLFQADYAAAKQSSVRRKAILQREEITKTLVALLPDVEAIEFIAPNPANLKPSVGFKTPYGWVSIWDLSHGYQTLIAWVVDFARRMFERYPESKNPLAEPAVVLVDEIDLHLHPKWQQSLMSYLTKRFPNTQFIVTAHSPLIVQGAKDVNVVLLRREGDHVVIENRDSESIRNWRVDQILTSDLFGLESVRPPYVEEKLAERRKLLSKAKLTKKDQERLKKLEAEIGPLPTGDSPQEIKAMDIINRAAKLLSERSGVK